MVTMGLVEIQIEDALVESKMECPICNLVDKAVDSVIDSLLYELVNDVEVRSQLRSKMLCRTHVSRIESYLAKHMELGSMGLAIIYADLLDQLAKFDGVMTHRFECFLCEKEKAFESLYTQAFLKNLGSLMNVYSASESILCFDHYALVLSKLENSLRKSFKEIQLMKYKRLLQLLDSFIKKHDYRNSESFTPEEIMARKKVGKLIGRNLQDWRRSK